MTRLSSKAWELHSLLVPVVAAALIGAVAWVVQASAAAHFNRLTVEDERRITAGAQAYADKRVDAIRDDLAQIREELVHLRDLQAEVLLQLRSQDSSRQISR